MKKVFFIMTALLVAGVTFAQDGKQGWQVELNAEVGILLPIIMQNITYGPINF